MSDAVDRPPGERNAAWRRGYRTMLTLLGITGVVLVLLLIALGIWWRGLQEQRRLVRALPRPPPIMPLPVAVITPDPTPVAATIRLPVKPEAPESRRVTAPVAGRLVSLAPSGARVEAGQVVARVQTTRRVVQRQPSATRVRPPQPDSRPPRAAGASAAARARAVQAARRRLEQAEQATRAAGAELSAARKAQPRRERSRESPGREVADAQAALARARAELGQREAALRVSERLYRAGAAARAELNADAEARAAAAQAVAQAQARLQAARALPGTLLSPSAAPSSAPALAAAERQVARARTEVSAARAALRAAMQAAAPGGGAGSPSSSPAPRISAGRRSPGTGARQALGWKEVVRTIEVRAPVSGIVTRRSARAGSQVPRGAGLLSVEGGRPRAYRTAAPADRLRGLRLPAPALLRAPSGMTVPARVSGLASQGEDTVILRVTPESRVASASEQLASAKQLWLELKAPGPDRALRVPEKAVHSTSEGPAVWVARRTAQNGREAWTAHRQPVRVARRQGEAALIGEGLEPDSRVIIAGTEPLHEGQAVAAIPWRLP